MTLFQPKVLIAATLFGCAGILTYQLFVPPIVGLADQGDFARVLHYFGLGPKGQTVEERYYAYLNRIYVPDPEFRTRGWEFFTSELFFVGAAVGLNRWISADGSFDVCVLGFAHAVTFLLCIYLLLSTVLPAVGSISQLFVCAACLFLFCDGSYTAYFNSFYSESATLLFFFLLIAFWVGAISSRSAGWVVAFACAGVLWILAKPQNCIPGLLLALYVLRFLWIGGSRRFRSAVAGASLALLGASAMEYVNTPRAMKQAAVYNLIFREMLPSSSHPEQDLRALKLDPAWMKYAGTGAFTLDSGLRQAGFGEALLSRVNGVDVAWFYLRRPNRLWLLAASALPYSTWLRPPYGNFEKKYAPLSQSEKWRTWSDFKQRSLSPWASGLLLFIALSATLSVWLSYRSAPGPARLFYELFAMLALMACVAFFTVILGDADDIVRHMFLYNLLTDTCLVMIAVFAAEGKTRVEKPFAPRAWAYAKEQTSKEHRQPTKR